MHSGQHSLFENAGLDVFERAVKSRSQDAVFVLHRPGCDDCRDFISNAHMELGGKDLSGVKMVRINLERKSDMKDLRKLIKINRGTQWPVVVVLRKGHGILKKMYKPNVKSVHAHIERLRRGGRRGSRASLSLEKLQKILGSDSHAADLTPLGTEARIARDVRRGDGGQLVCLHNAISGNCLVMFKRDGCGYCRKLEPHFMRLADTRLPRELGMYTVDTDEHYGQVKMILKNLSDAHGYPEDLVNMPGVPTVALFQGQFAPQIVSSRDYESLREEIKNRMVNVFVDVTDPSNRVDIKKVADQNAAVLFIDWRHKPCLQMLNKVRNAVEKIKDKSKMGNVKVYAFNVYNHQDMWDKICNDYRIQHSGVALEVLSVPQIIYFFKRRRVPAVRRNITKFDSDQIAHDISQQYKLGYKAQLPSFSDDALSYLTAEEGEDHRYIHSMSDFAGGDEVKVSEFSVSTESGPPGEAAAAAAAAPLRTASAALLRAAAASPLRTASLLRAAAARSSPAARVTTSAWPR